MNTPDIQELIRGELHLLNGEVTQRWTGLTRVLMLGWEGVNQSTSPNESHVRTGSARHPTLAGRLQDMNKSDGKPSAPSPGVSASVSLTLCCICPCQTAAALWEEKRTTKKQTVKLGPLMCPWQTKEKRVELLSVQKTVSRYGLPLLVLP